MRTLEVLTWMILASVVLGLIVTGIAVMIGMAVEVYEAEVRELRRKLRQRWRDFLGERKEASA